MASIGLRRQLAAALGGTTVAVAKDLGVFHRERHAHAALTAIMSAKRSAAARLRTLGGGGA